MFLGKVVGTVWSTKKTPDLEGVRFLIVHPYDLDKEPTRNIVVVADRLGAGTGEMVICAFGKAARTAIGNARTIFHGAGESRLLDPLLLAKDREYTPGSNRPTHLTWHSPVVLSHWQDDISAICSSNG